MCRREDRIYGEIRRNGTVNTITYVNGLDDIIALTAKQASFKYNKFLSGKDKNKMLELIKDCLAHKRVNELCYNAIYPGKIFKRKVRLVPFRKNSCLFFIQDQ